MNKIKRLYHLHVLRRRRTRWLRKAAAILKKQLLGGGYLIPKSCSIRCGVLVSNGTNSHVGDMVLGTCSYAGKMVIAMKIDNVDTVIETLIHEFVHLLIGESHQHDRLFRECLKSIERSAAGTHSQILETLPLYPQWQ